MSKEIFFLGNQFVRTDAAFQADGRFMSSYKNNGNNPNKIHFNTTFH
jgi:hypothetical protein